MNIYIENPGYLDIRAITTMGVSAKENDSAIGYFGTGLKYAIAVTLRLGGSVRLWNHDTLWSFRTKNETIRDKEFQLIEMVGVSGKDTGTIHPLPITTEVGKNWEPWQSLREFLCNAMDERGGVVSSFDCKPNTVVFDVHAEPYDAIRSNDFSEIFMAKNAPILYEDDKIQIIQKESKYGFYKGVRVCELGRGAQLTYNMKQGLTLTEDRTYHVHGFASRCRLAAVSCPSAEVHRICISPREDAFEDYWFDHDGSADYHPDLVAKVVSLKRSGRPIFKKLYYAMMPLIMKDGLGEETTMTQQQERMLSAAIGFIERAGYPMTIPVKYVSTLGPGVMGQMHDDTCYITKTAFDMGMRQLIGTLMEEQIHHQYNVRDCTREMQNKLFDLLVGEIANHLGEVI